MYFHSVSLNAEIVQKTCSGWPPCPGLLPGSQPCDGLEAFCPDEVGALTPPPSRPLIQTPNVL